MDIGSKGVVLHTPQCGVPWFGCECIRCAVHPLLPSGVAALELRVVIEEAGLVLPKVLNSMREYLGAAAESEPIVDEPREALQLLSRLENLDHVMG